MSDSSYPPNCTFPHALMTSSSDLATGSSSTQLYTDAFGPLLNDSSALSLSLSPVHDANEAHQAALLRRLRGRAHSTALKDASKQLVEVREALRKMRSCHDELQRHLFALQQCWDELCKLAADVPQELVENAMNEATAAASAASNPASSPSPPPSRARVSASPSKSTVSSSQALNDAVTNASPLLPLRVTDVAIIPGCELTLEHCSM